MKRRSRTTSKSPLVCRKRGSPATGGQNRELVSQPKAATTPDYTGLQLQTSVNTLPIPIVWGQTKAAANMIWYQQFSDATAAAARGKGGFFGGGDASSYTYTADLIMALCEGPIFGIGIIWKDQSTYTLAELGLTLFNGTTPQTIWGYLSTAYPIQALAYQGTAMPARRVISSATKPTSAITISRSLALSLARASTASTPIPRRSSATS